MHFDTRKKCGGEPQMGLPILQDLFLRLIVLLRDTVTDLIPVIILEINFTYNLSEQ